MNNSTKITVVKNSNSKVKYLNMTLIMCKK